jgi:hypothetical protein
MTGQVTCFTRAKGVADAQIDGETMLMAPTDRRCFGVNRTGTRVWELLPPAEEIGVTADHLVERLMDAYDVQRSVCFDEVTRLLAAMVDAGVASRSSDTV